MTKAEWKEYVQAAVNEVAAEFGNINVLSQVKGLDKGTLYKWRNGKSVPKVDTFLRAFPEYNFEGIDQCVKLSRKGAPTKNNRPLPTIKKFQEENEKHVEKATKEYCASDEQVLVDYYEASMCNACVHQKVCKYSEDFYKLEDHFNKEFSIIKTKLIIAHAKLECNEFESVLR